MAQSVTCLATDARLTADPGVVSSFPNRKIDHEIISTDIVFSSVESFKNGC